ncbi:hypothetical protein H6P81_003948 [Aristolochia fimbriata]|uniref:Uncharacterized protein n=1 Tax=Aristolochia fimbriata TaxID=158543 RepID=A0AAV7FE13_ARIFI|nr:hypothetical protein H6P81_003948 [Aristolochia fimbriata]
MTESVISKGPVKEGKIWKNSRQVEQKEQVAREKHEMSNNGERRKNRSVMKDIGKRRRATKDKVGEKEQQQRIKSEKEKSKKGEREKEKSNKGARRK